MNRTEVKMDDLPELPFEKVLSYLSLEDRLKSMAVSRRWYKMISSFKVKSLCWSKRPSGFIERKSRLVTDAFAQNFVSAPRIESLNRFANTFRETILSNLKYLRICDLGAEPSSLFAQTVNLFGRLEKLDIIGFDCTCCPPPTNKDLELDLELDLPMLESIEISQIIGIGDLTLFAPKLQKIKIWWCESVMSLNIVHAESVEWLSIDELGHLTLVRPGDNLKNLKYLCIDSWTAIGPTFLSSLEQLKEIHLCGFDDIAGLFEQKRRYGRTDLKIYLSGLLLNDPDVLTSYGFGYWADDPSGLANEIPFYISLNYEEIEAVAPELALNVVKRFSNLECITVDRPVQDVQRFLDLLKNLEHLVELKFECHQPRDLFDRLPEHCAVQKLTIWGAPSDFEFLPRLEHLITLELGFSIYARTIRKVLKELKFLLTFGFQYNNKPANIYICDKKQFSVRFDGQRKSVTRANAAIQLIVGKRNRRVANRHRDLSRSNSLKPLI